MTILVKYCQTGHHDGPNNGASGARRTVSPGRHKARHPPFQGSFWPFPLRLNHKVRCFDPKSSDFSQFKPTNIIKTYPSQIIKSKLRNIEERGDKKSSRTLVPELHKLQLFQPQNLSIFQWISSPSMWDFTSGFLSPIGSLVFNQIFYSLVMGCKSPLWAISVVITPSMFIPLAGYIWSFWWGEYIGLHI